MKIKGQYRRLAAEQAISMSGYKTFKECGIACEKLALSRGSDVTFNDSSVRHYVTCHTNLSMKRLLLLAELINVTNFKQLDEKFKAPVPRGVGKYWIGEYGSKVQDYDASTLLE